VIQIRTARPLPDFVQEADDNRGVMQPGFPTTRRALRAAAEAERAIPARHVRRADRLRRTILVAVAAVLLIGGGSATLAALGASTDDDPSTSEVTSAADATTTDDDIRASIVPLPDDGLPTPVISGGRTDAGGLCDDPALAEALSAGDDAAAIQAAGGAEAFRTAVAAGAAPCISLDDPARSWVVVNKLRPYQPIDAAPSEIVIPQGVRSLEEAGLTPDAAGALTALVAGAAEAGAGELALQSAYRSYTTQQQTYAGHVAQRGVDGADLVSARPGFSEHQSGLTVDVVPCTNGSCGTLDDLAGTPQGDWLVAHAHEYGWIVRYTEGHTDVTGYAPEPWHLRYIGTDLAGAYAAGGWTSLEEFFGLPAAPDYAE
jgi:zinc D-Ala-D-Ala carboxypeptidase